MSYLKLYPKWKISIPLAFIIIFLVSAVSFTQSKVAQYSFGKSNTDRYEEFAFWAKGGKRTGIYYTYGKDHRNIPVQYLGIDKINGEKCFKVKFSNGYSLFIIPRGNQLNIIDSAGKYNKTFSWEYEGPVNGIGTHCDACAENDTDAMNLLRSCYLR